MKIIFKSILIALFLAGFNTVSAQTIDKNFTRTKKIETCELTVTGVCKMCKKRIEKAALIKGVKFAEWDKEKQKLKVVYNTKKTTEEEIHNAVAGVGHDTNKVKAKDEIYSKLPGCCKYRDGVKVH